MRRWNRYVWIMVAASALLGTPGALAAGSKPAKMEVGVKAPEFALTGSDGKTYRLSDYLGKQAVVIAWFPKAFTGG